MSLTREQILAAKDLPSEPVHVPEWGGDLFVRTMTGVERDAFEQSLLSNRGKDKQVNTRNIRARLVVLCAVDAKGNRLFADDDAGALGKKSAAALDRVFAVAQRLNGLRDTDVEELAGN